MAENLARSCWSIENARSILLTEALAGNDAVFLATHTPVKGFEIAGSANDVTEASEEGLLRALSDPARRHAFCVVQGEPGSGKSHLIRWLSVNWPIGSDLPLLIQRANGSLEGTLRQLQSQLRGEFQHLFENIGRRQAAALSGRATQFLVTMGAALGPDYFEKPMPDAVWCRENDPSSLVLNNYVRQQWSGPMRILKLLDGSGDRNSESASFDLEDIVDLARHCGQVHDSVASERLARRLMKEADLIEEALDEGRTKDEIKATNANELRSSLTFINALNRRRNYAVQHVIGVSADGLKKLFEELREELGRKGQRLVLLLEDITSWEGLDDTLVDALVTDAQTRPEADLCPLISVVGVTPYYFSTLPGNYRQRITHEIALGQQKQGQLQDVAALRDADDRSAFVARYLNAARAGEDQLNQWRERFRTDRTLPPPNPCHDCSRLDPCHDVFGEVGRVGLFPFTRAAIDNFFFALKEDDSGMTHRTPRGVVQAILSPTLMFPNVIDENGYPGPQLEVSALERRTLPSVLQSRLTTHVAESTDRDRLRRLFSYWGDRRPELRVGADGDPTYAGVSESLASAFSLPWIADDVTSTAPTNPSARAQLPSIEPETPRQKQAPRDAGPSRSRPAPAVGPTLTRPPTRGQLERLRNEITALRENQPLQNSSSWNAAVFDIMKAIDIRKIGVDRWTWSKLFTGETIKIANTGAIRSSHFVLPRADWLADGLEAYTALNTEELSEEETEYSLRKLTAMIRQLELLVAEHLERRLPKTDEGQRWNPVVTATQILLARAWLRGVTSAERPTHEQWAALLSDESDAESDPAARTQSWQEALSATKNQHDPIRKALREMVRIPQGSSSGFGIADASVAAVTIIALRDHCELRLQALDSHEQLPSDMETLCEVATRLTPLPSIPGQEKKLLSGRADELLGLLRKQAIVAHLRRLDAIIAETSNKLPGLVPHLIRDWRSSLERSRRVANDASTASQVQSTILAVTDGADDLPAKASLLLGWLASAPASDLKVALELAKQGESVVKAILPHVEDIVSDASRAAGLGDLHATGSQLREAAARARAASSESTK